MQVLEQQPWSVETSLTLHVVPEAMWQVPLMHFAIKIDPRSQRQAMKFPFCVKLPDFQKERIPSGDQKTMFFTYLKASTSAEYLSLSLPKKGLHPEGVAKTKFFQAMAFREKDIKDAFFKNGKTWDSHTKRRHKGTARRSLPLKEIVSSLPAFPCVLPCPGPLFATC